jgi:hypothetical protein
VLFLVRLDLTCAAWEVNARQLREDLKALQYLPEGARVAGAVVVDVRATGRSIPSSTHRAMRRSGAMRWSIRTSPFPASTCCG